MPGLAFLLRTAEPDREALSAACALARESGVSEALALLLEQQRDAAPGGWTRLLTYSREGGAPWRPRT